MLIALFFCILMLPLMMNYHHIALVATWNAAFTLDGVSYRQIGHLENADFLEAAYLLLLGRPLDEPSRKTWQGSLSMPKQELQTLVLKTIMQSGEYQKSRISLTDCPFALFEGEQKNLLISSQALPERLVRMYQKMPRFMQKLAKKAAGKE